MESIAERNAVFDDHLNKGDVDVMVSMNGGSRVLTECGDGDTHPQFEIITETEEKSENEDEKQSGDSLNIFAKNVRKRANIYSTAPTPLNTPWTFWVDHAERGLNVEEYEAHLKRIYTIFTVYRFWGAYSNIPQPSALQVRSSLHMMRDDRKPVWEEPYNCKGGTFRLRCSKQETDKIWKEVLLAAIGETFTGFVGEQDEICGVSVSIRESEDVILIWNTNAQEAAKAQIFPCIHKLLPDSNFKSEFYKPHVTHHAFERRKLSKKQPNLASNSNPASASTSATSSN